MQLDKWRCWAVCLFIFAPMNFSCAQQNASTFLRNLIEDASLTSAPMRIENKSIYHEDWLILFYHHANHQLSWTEYNAIQLVSAVESAWAEGLDPADYHAEILRRYMSRREKSERDIAYFDILLTDAFLHYGTHLLRGKTDPVILYGDKWESNRRELDLVMLLQDALEDASIVSTLEGLQPEFDAYRQLKLQLRFYSDFQTRDAWPHITDGEILEPGLRDQRIPLIRKRLALTGQLTDNEQVDEIAFDSVRYDSALVVAVKEFQREHGLTPDGVIGPHTIVALNHPPSYYMGKIAANLERFRWLPWALGDDYVVVNIPGFDLTVFEHDSAVMRMKAIVGRPERSTPVFSSEIRYIILNPTWTIPPTILKEDVLPAVKRNSGYLKQNNIRVINNLGAEVNADSIPWESYTEKNFPYQLRQDPGIQNSLGLIKFQFPNQHKVFLHDTNAPALFSNSDRALSSGCVRIEHPFVLAAHILEGTRWTRKNMDKEVDMGRTRSIVLAQPVPIHLLYFTAFVDQGRLQIRDDIYEWDEKLSARIIGQPVP